MNLFAFCRSLALMGLMLRATAACSNAPAAERPSDGNQVADAPRPALALQGRVTDAAGILTVADEARLAYKLQQFEKATAHQMVVVTVPSLGGQDVATFTRDLGKSWGIGRKGINDGVVVLVAPKERATRIAVGYGLEATLTYAVCHSIIERNMLTRFRAGDLPGGIGAGVDALIAVLQPEKVPSTNANKGAKPPVVRVVNPATPDAGDRKIR